MDFMRLWPSRHAARQAREDVHARQLMTSLLMMAWFVEAKDPYSGGHLWRVSRYAALLARAAGLNDGEIARITLGGFLHDLGKIGIPDAILRKPEKLTDEEYAVMRTHPDIGLRMIGPHPFFHLVRSAIESHHERPDGKGYPDGLKSEAIPMDARIVGICDTFDAMTSARPYRHPMPVSKALDILQSEAGRQFDSRLVGTFISLGVDGKLDHIVGHSDDGIPLLTCPMCGPTLVFRRGAKPDTKIYCHSCAGEFELKASGVTMMAEPTGRMGGPIELVPAADDQLIAATVNQIVRELPIQLLFGREERR